MKYLLLIGILLLAYTCNPENKTPENKPETEKVRDTTKVDTVGVSREK